MVQGIYRLINNINDKVYVGQSINIEQRFKEHIYHLNSNSHHAYKLQMFYNQNKHNKNFQIDYDVLEVIENDKYLNTRESHYINLYNSYNNGYNSISMNGDKTHTKKNYLQNKKLDKINDSKEEFHYLSNKYISNLYLQHGGYNDTYLYRVNEAIKYFVKNYNLSLHKAEIKQYKANVNLLIIDKDFQVLQEYKYISEYNCIGLDRYTYRTKTSRKYRIQRYEKFDNIIKSKRRYEYLLKRFNNLDEDIIRHNVLKYSSNKYRIPISHIRDIIGYEYDSFKKHIIDDKDIQKLSKGLGINYLKGHIEIDLN